MKVGLVSANQFNLEEECYSLFGEGWQSEVARRLGVKTRSVKRWADGTNMMPPEIVEFVRFWQGGAS